MNLNDPKFPGLTVGATSRIELWVRLLTGLSVKTMAEVGVWKGEYAKQVLERCPELERYYLIDPWEQLPDWNKPYNVDARSFDEIYNAAMENTAFAARKRVVLRGRTKAVVDQIADQSLDLAYVDGDHTLRGITIDLIKMLPKVKENGFLGGDDFTADPWHHRSRYEPTLVCPFAAYFAEAMDLPMIILPFNQFLIQNRPAAGFSLTDTTGLHGDLSINSLLGRNRPGRLGRVLTRIGLGK